MSIISRSRCRQDRSHNLLYLVPLKKNLLIENFLTIFYLAAFYLVFVSPFHFSPLIFGFSNKFHTLQSSAVLILGLTNLYNLSHFFTELASKMWNQTNVESNFFSSLFSSLFTFKVFEKTAPFLENKPAHLSTLFWHKG